MSSGHPHDDPKESSGSIPRAPGFRVADRRISARQDADSLAAADEEQRRLPTYLEELEAQTKLAQRRLEEKARWFEEEVSRVRERLEREQDRKMEAGKRRILTEFLEVADNMERALDAAAANPEPEALRNGLELIRDSLFAKLGQLGVQVLELQGQPFDPEACEALVVTEVNDPAQDQKVIRVFQAGYRIGDQILRPAKVSVGRYPSQS